MFWKKVAALVRWSPRCPIDDIELSLGSGDTLRIEYVVEVGRLALPGKYIFDMEIEFTDDGIRYKRYEYRIGW